MSISYIGYEKVVCKYIITQMSPVKNFEVIFERFNIYRGCA